VYVHKSPIVLQSYQKEYCRPELGMVSPPSGLCFWTNEQENHSSTYRYQTFSSSMSVWPQSINPSSTTPFRLHTSCQACPLVWNESSGANIRVMDPWSTLHQSSAPLINQFFDAISRNGGGGGDKADDEERKRAPRAFR
jgi:hypothetical protein